MPYQIIGNIPIPVCALAVTIMDAFWPEDSASTIMHAVVLSNANPPNSSGTSTPKNDLSETLAIRLAFGEYAHSVHVSSTKSMIGHALGGAGALEAVACIKTIMHNEIHPTINYDVPDPECDLDYVPNFSRKTQVDTILSNSFGFGGQNACLVFKRFEE